ncbi:MAG: hypothetical protein CV045_02220 [Cyanobacteria bacterium M5B4]|nr:hypothetical protein [Cyanobacteria bacterium KgW148]PLS69396.1 MAG: hypothetical protein CV045_02220 [Cyanobacteria bacterium M5B4]
MIRQITYDPPLPLTMYRELAAHLGQLEGVTTELLPQTSDRFDYSASQIMGIRVQVPQGLPPRAAEILEQILHYYGSFHQITL